MPQIATLPQAPNTGLGTLGQVLLAGATDYAQNKRSDDREARHRAQRLSDVEDDRRYEGATYEKRRGDRLAEVEDSRRYTEEQQQVAMRRELVRLGYLSPTEIKDEQAVAAAVQRAQRDGIADRYKDALAAGDLTWADIIAGDEARIDAALAKFSNRLAERTKFQADLPGQAKSRADQLVGERDQLLQRAAALEHRLAEPEPQPSPQQVAQRALELAQANKRPGEMPSAVEIQQMTGQAVQEIGGRLAMQWNQQRQDALVQRSLINDRLRDVGAEINTLTNRFGVVGVGQPGVAAPSPTPTTSAPKVDLGTAQKNFASAIAEQLGKRKAPATPAPSNRLSTDTGSNYPGLSIMGAAERIGSAAPKIASRLAEVPVRIDKALGAIGGGLLTGDYSVPQVGGLGQLGEAYADNAIAANERADEDILRNAPYSFRAMEIRRRRGIPEPTPLMK